MSLFFLSTLYLIKVSLGLTWMMSLLLLLCLIVFVVSFQNLPGLPGLDGRPVRYFRLPSLCTLLQDNYSFHDMFHQVSQGGDVTGNHDDAVFLPRVRAVPTVRWASSAPGVPMDTQ